MTGFKYYKGCWILCLASILILSGCKQKSAVKPNGAATHQSPAAVVASQQELSGAEILSRLRSRYENAVSYQDQAVLYLSYQLNGRHIQEPQRWSTTWDSNSRLAMQLFNGQVLANGKLLSCYIYDIETENLDNQHLLMPYDRQLPLNPLLRDSIARHFLGGYSELPLDETDLVSAPKLIPPTIALLTKQATNGWLQKPSQVERQPDQVVEDIPCFVVRSLFEGMTTDVFIARETFHLVQMSLPLKLLAGEVVTSPEIQEVVLLAKFHDAVFDQPIPDEEFSIKPRPDATPVMKFVALPESLPTQLIGHSAPQFNLIGLDRQPIDESTFDQKVTTLLWLAGRPSYRYAEELDQLARQLEPNQFEFGVVYSDSELKSPASGSIELIAELGELSQILEVPFYLDPMLAASAALQIKVIPSIIVLDGSSKVQFAKPLSGGDWTADVQAALERVAAGEDVATEMRSDYERYVGSYQQQLATVSASEWLPKSAATSNTTQVKTNHDFMPVHRGNVRLRPEKSWSNAEFQRAGNVSVVSLPEVSAGVVNQVAFLVFDGWRTVVELNQQGQTLRRIELSLPENTGVNLIRIGSSTTGEVRYAVFSALGNQVFLFDRDWKTRGNFPAEEADHMGIVDCRFADLNGDGNVELVVGFDGEMGVQLVDPGSMQGEKISTAIVSSIVPFRGDVAVAGLGKLGTVKSGLQEVEATELEFKRLAALGDQALCGLGVKGNGQWNAVGFDSNFQSSWTLAVGSQFFETEIEPIAVAKSSTGEILWAIADTQDTIHLVSGGGKWLGDFQSDSRLGGLALASDGHQVRLIVTNQTGVECWDLNLSTSPMRPASTTN